MATKSTIFLAIGIILALVSFFEKKEKRKQISLHKQRDFITTKRMCNECGSELYPGDNYCPECGKKILP